MNVTSLAICLVVPVTLLSAGCGSTKAVKKLTLAQAICEVQEAIIATRRDAGTTQAGLMPAEVTVTLQLTAKETSSRSVGVALPNGVSTWTLGSSASSEGNHANTMAIKFIPAALTPVNVALGEAIAREKMTPTQVIGMAEDQGWNTHGVDDARDTLGQWAGTSGPKNAGSQPGGTTPQKNGPSPCTKFADDSSPPLRR